MNKQNLNKSKRNKTQPKHHSGLLFLLCSCFISIIFIFTFVWTELNKEDTTPVVVSNNQTSTNNIVNTNEWNLILVNKSNKIPSSYSVDLTQLDSGEQVDNRIYKALQEMFDSAKAKGLRLVVVSGYRSTEEQQRILDDKILAYEQEGNSLEAAKKKALEWVAQPGYSEHQLGISVDINADTRYSSDDEVYNWLAKNAHKYGFIYRYPSNKTNITDVINEPWHYRYVGVEAATTIYQKGICLEEYLGATK